MTLVGTKIGRPEPAAWVLAMFLGGCAAPYVAPPLPAEHPASPLAAESPPPPPSTVLSAESFLPQPPSGAREGGAHAGHHGHHGPPETDESLEETEPGKEGMHHMHGGHK